MRVVIQKFGGTSVATEAKRAEVAQRIAAAVRNGLNPVVVVSAMGRYGEPYATDTLIGLLNGATGAVNRRELDLLMSCGETISAVVMAHTLNSQGITATALTGEQAGIITDERFGEARVLYVKTERLTELLAQGVVPVVTGFQGVSEHGEITTLGRGGSDTSAAVLGVALKAACVEIYTDVDGVKTADPRLVPDALTLRRMTYAEVIEMALLGAKVIHPRAVEIAREAGLPLKILCASGETTGTLITRGQTDGRLDSFDKDRPVVGIAHVLGRAQVQLDIDGRHGSGVSQIFQSLGDAGISVDMIQVSPESICVTIDAKMAEHARAVLKQLGCEPKIAAGFAKVSVVGGGMHGVPGIMARVADALSKANIMIYQTADSHANISCLVREEDAAETVVALHQEFDLHNQSSLV
ncbi:MAG TPA: aspartate kinase [Firmicutes bacterium]|jgi:aspartate kinase|nr:aspartate kinase [Bacillota bacterium]